MPAGDEAPGDGARRVGGVLVQQGDGGARRPTGRRSVFEIASQPSAAFTCRRDEPLVQVAPGRRGQRARRPARRRLGDGPRAAPAPAARGAVHRREQQRADLRQLLLERGEAPGRRRPRSGRSRGWSRRRGCAARRTSRPGTGSATGRPGSRRSPAPPAAGRATRPAAVALSTYAPGDARYPGANSSVTHAPPTISRRSSTSVRSPARGEVEGRDETVVAGPDDDRVVLACLSHC